MLDKLSVDEFMPAVGQTFTLDVGEAGTLDLELVGASTHPPDTPSKDESGNRSPFSVRFRGPAEPILGQRIYRLDNETVGPLEIFIVPLGVDERGTTYEAIFA